MKNIIEIKTKVEEFDSINDLNPEEHKLMLEAVKASESAYAPYSEFYVGAALLLENGEVITGNNQENIAYPSGLCAERVAVYAAGAKFPEIKIKTIAVIARSKNFLVDHPVSPCGACRQAMSEYEMRYGSNIRVLMKGETGAIRAVESIQSLLPLMFNETGLKKK